MEGYEVEDEKGNRMWWDGTRILPYDKALLRQAGQQSAQEATKVSGQLTRNVVTPLVQAGLGLASGGLSLPAQALIGGGTEFAAQKLGLSPESTTQIGLAAATPMVGPALVKGFKGAAKATANFLSPSATREAGVGAAVSQMGANPDVISRIKTPSASSIAYKDVGATFSEVPTNIANRGITTALNEIPASAESKAAREYLQNLSSIFDTEGSMPYERMAKEIQGMRLKSVELNRANDPAGAAAVRQARQKILGEMEKVSPDLLNANALFKRENNISKLEDILTKPRADIAFNQAIKKDKLLASMPEEDLRMVKNIANQLTKIGGSASPYSGVSAKLLNFFATPLAGMIESDTGRAFLRKMFSEGSQVSPAAISNAVQFWRAYQAQNPAEQ